MHLHLASGLRLPCFEFRRVRQAEPGHEGAAIQRDGRFETGRIVSVAGCGQLLAVALHQARIEGDAVLVDQNELRLWQRGSQTGEQTGQLAARDGVRNVRPEEKGDAGARNRLQTSGQEVQ